MKNSREFKHTEIGMIPNGWEVVRLSDMGDLKDGDWILKENYTDTGVRLLQVGDIGFGNFLNKSARFISLQRAGELRCSYVVPDEDILISRMPDPIGRACIAPALPYPYIVAVDITILKPKKEKVFSKYLVYSINSSFVLSRVKQFAAGATRQRISRYNLEEIKLPLPPLPEQQKIAEILMTTDEAIEKVNEAIEKTERLKKGLMHELLTKGIGHKEFKETEIGRLPKEWEVWKIGDISLDFLGGGTPSTSNPSYWDGDIAWMTSAHINGRNVTTGQRYITKEGLKNSAAHLVPKDNLLIATRVGIGKVAVNKIDIAISQDLTGVIFDKTRVMSDFLYWSLSTKERKLKSLAQGSTIKGILREELAKFKLPLPPLPEQQKISEILSTVDKKLELLREKKERFERIKKGLMNDLLTGRKRVKI